MANKLPQSQIQSAAWGFKIPDEVEVKYSAIYIFFVASAFLNHLYMKKLLFVLWLAPVSLLFAQTDPLLKELRQKWVNSQQYMLAVAQAMPEQYFDFAPTPDEMTFRQQLLHMTGNICWLAYYNDRLVSEVPPFKMEAINTAYKNKTMSKQEVIDILQKTFEYGTKVMESFDPATYDDPVKFFAGPQSKRKILLLLFDHQTHHRGQLVVYLRLKGIAPPRYVGW